MKKSHKSEEKETRADRNEFLKSPKFWNVALTVLFLVAAVGTAIHLRLATVDIDATDRWAASAIEQQIKAQISAQIRQAYPTLPDASVQTKAQEQWDAYKKDHLPEIQEQQRIISANYKQQFQFDAGRTEKYQQTYVLEMDPYLWWHQAENYAGHGSVCDEGNPTLPDGSCKDLKRLAPTGTTERLGLHTWLEAMMIRIVRAFNDNTDTLTIIFFLPVILAALAVIPAFFIGRKIGGNIGGLIAGIIIATHPILINRTVAGFSDTDGYNFLFPLLVVWLLIEAFESKKLWSKITLSALAALCMGLFSFAWGGWWFSFFIMLVCLIGFILFKLAMIIYENHWKKLSGYKTLYDPALIFAVFLVASAIFVTLFTTWGNFAFSFAAPFSYSTGLQAATQGAGDLSGWPNVLTTVAELNVPSLDVIVGNLGGKMIVVFAAFGLFVTLINPRKINWPIAGLAALVFVYYYLLITKGLALSPYLFLFLFALPLIAAILVIFIKDIQLELHLAFFMMAWLLATLFASTKGIRFLLLGIPPFAVGFGIAIGWIYIALTSALEQEIKKPLAVKAIVGILLLLIVLNPVASYSPLKRGAAAANQQLPGMNDAWWDTMKVIREQTPPDTIITSWWDFGHWFRNIGNRSVTFDGGSQNPVPAHFVGKILLSPNEKESIGVLRMLDCGGNGAYEIAHKHLDVVPAKTLVDSIVLLDKTSAAKALSKTTIPTEDQQKILAYTHCEAPSAVFITSGDMIGKAGVWGHFGNWDFKRSVAYEYAKQLPEAQAVEKMQQLGYSEADSISMYATIRSFTNDYQGNTWISAWPSYFTQEWRSCEAKNKTVTCSLYMGIQQTEQGTVAIETVNFNIDTPQNATVSIALYGQRGKLTESASSTVIKVAVADFDKNKFFVYNRTSSDFNMGLLIRKDSGGTNETQYSVLITDPLQTDSLFTHLYFLDGAFTKHFTKFVERTEPGGSKIIVWNVAWPEN